MTPRLAHTYRQARRNELQGARRFGATWRRSSIPKQPAYDRATARALARTEARLTAGRWAGHLAPLPPPGPLVQVRL